MAISTLHKLDKLVFPSSVEIGQLRSARWGAGINSLLERPAGHPYPMFRTNLEQKPVMEFTTPEIDVILNSIGVGGASFGAIVTYFKKTAATGSDARASATHRKITINSSYGHWTTLNLPHNGQGEINVTLTAVYDGTNNPFVYAGSSALSGNLGAGTHFGAGPVSINGTPVPGVQEITVESGVRLIQAGSSSEVWDTFVGLEMTEPKVTIRTLENINWVTLGLAGTALDGTNGLVFYARKFAQNGARVADATAQHVKFIGLLGTAIPVDSSGQGSSPISDTLVCELISSSDSVAPLTGTVSSAIT